MKHFGMPILRVEDPKRFLIEITGRFLAGLLFVGMELFFCIEMTFFKKHPADHPYMKAVV